MIRRLTVLAATLTLAACDAAPPAAAPVETEAAKAEDAVHFSERRMVAADTYAVVFPTDADRVAVEAAARDVCGSRQWCKVLGWTDPAFAARALPMTDREVEAQAFVLTINRASGLDEVIWS